MKMISFMHKGQLVELSSGVHFGLPEDIYHAIPALSSTGIKNLLISPTDFWFNSWMNPLRELDAEDEESVEWKRFGKASHTRILEGKERFDRRYVVEFIPQEGCLDTVSDLKKACVDLGIQAASKWNKPDYIAAILQHNPEAMILDVEKKKYAQITGGRIQLSQDEMRRIEIAAAMIEHHPQLKHCFVGGEPEVSAIFERDGILCKVRWDYLKPLAFLDLKTFRNANSKPIDSALYDVMGSRKYHIQIAFYDEAVPHLRQALKEGRITVHQNDMRPSPDFIRSTSEATGSLDTFIVFQKKGGAPLARGKKFYAESSVGKCGKLAIEHGIQTYRSCMERFGTGIWVDDTAISDFDDGLFPVYTTEV